MTIQNQKTLSEIQWEFNEKFPFLQLKFYVAGHNVGAHSPNYLPLDSSKSIGEVRTVHSEGDLSINPNQKISTLEQHFAAQFGLNVQVFRMSGNIWLQTTTTDNWTLAQANRKGEHSVAAYNEKA